MGAVLNMYAREVERLEMHLFDGAHLLLETHYRECADAIRPFIARVANPNCRTM